MSRLKVRQRPFRVGANPEEWSLAEIAAQGEREGFDFWRLTRDPRWQTWWMGHRLHLDFWLVSCG